jgi:hypothetical protein
MGYDLTPCIAQVRERLSNYFEDVFVFTPRTLKELKGSEDFCNSWSEPLDSNPNANHVGYFDFKGFLLEHVMSQVPEGSIIVYHDGNFKRNPQYWHTDWPNLESIIEQILAMNQTDLMFQFEQADVKVKFHVKEHVLERMFPDKVERDIIADSCLIGAARIIVRNTGFAREFIREYRDLCLQKDLVAKSPIGNARPEFKWSCGDQDVLNALVYRYILDGKLPSTFPGFSFLYRVIRFENSPFTWKFDEWEPWHDRPHMTGIQRVLNHDLINYVGGKA